MFLSFFQKIVVFSTLWGKPLTLRVIFIPSYTEVLRLTAGKIFSSLGLTLAQWNMITKVVDYPTVKRGT